MLLWHHEVSAMNYTNPCTYCSNTPTFLTGHPSQVDRQPRARFQPLVTGLAIVGPDDDVEGLGVEQLPPHLVAIRVLQVALGADVLGVVGQGRAPVALVRRGVVAEPDGRLPRAADAGADPVDRTIGSRG